MGQQWALLKNIWDVISVLKISSGSSYILTMVKKLYRSKRKYYQSGNDLSNILLERRRSQVPLAAKKIKIDAEGKQTITK